MSLKNSRNIVHQLQKRSISTKKMDIKGFNELYKVFYDFKEDNNPNHGYKCILKNFILDDLFNIKIDNIYYYDNDCKLTEINLDYINIHITPLGNIRQINGNFNTYKQGLSILISNIQKKYPYINIENILNNFYVSKDYKKLFIIDDNCVKKLYKYKFSNDTNFNFIHNIKQLEFLDNLPNISENNNIMLNNNILNRNSGIIRTDSSDNYKCVRGDLQIFIFNDNLNITKEFKNRNELFTLEGEINNWYYIHTSSLTQLIYITLEQGNKLNDLFLSLNMPFNINLRRVYKIFHEFKEDNPNREIQCIYKNVFKTSINNFKLFNFFKKPNNIQKFIYCYFHNNEVIDKESIQTPKPETNIQNYIIQNLDSHTLNSYFKYKNLYISEDGTILYYITTEEPHNCLHVFNVLNDNISFLDDLPKIVFSQKLSQQYNTDYFTINLNKTSLLSEDWGLLSKVNNSYKFSYNIQMFKFNDNKISKTNIKANTSFKLDDNIDDWYFIPTTIKLGKLIIGLDIYQDEDEEYDEIKIIQLIYITPDMIEKYNQMFIDLKIPYSFEIIQQTGGRKKVQRLLKIY